MVLEVCGAPPLHSHHTENLKGKSWVKLCRLILLPSTSSLKGFKLSSVHLILQIHFRLHLSQLGYTRELVVCYIPPQVASVN